MKRSCMVHRTPIVPGDTVVAVVLRQMPWLPTNSGHLDAPTDLWAPVSLPIYGVMGSLGLDEVEESWTKDALFGWLIDHADEDIDSKWAVGPLTPDTWAGPHAWAEMEKRIRQGTLMCNISSTEPAAAGHTSHLGITYMFAKTYDDLADAPVDVEAERKLHEAVKESRSAFQGNFPGLAEMVKSAKALQEEMTRLRFELEDVNIPFFGEGVMSYHRAYLAEREHVDDVALLDLLQFGHFQDTLRLEGIPWLPNVILPE